MVSAIIEFLARALRGVLADWRRDRALQDKGAADAALDTSRDIQEAADEQRKVDARDRGGAADVARRLRDRLRAGG